MNCNVFTSCFNSYSITNDGKIFSKYENRFLDVKVRDSYNEVLFSFGTGKERWTQWFRVDWLVALRYIPNPEGFGFVRHKDGNTLNDCVSNLEWKQYCTEERSKEIIGYRGKYIVTDTGKVFNNFTGTQMKTRLIQGYPHVGLRVYDGTSSIQKLFKVHRLVAEYFIPKVEGKNIVNHINGDKTDARASNLEWCTYSENNIHALKTGLRKTSWTKELGAVAITLIEDYNYSCSDVAALLNKAVSSVKYLYQRGYASLGLTINNKFVRKTSKYVKSKQIPETYKKYITQLLGDNTVLNKESKESLQCNDQGLNLGNRI